MRSDSGFVPSFHFAGLRRSFPFTCFFQVATALGDLQLAGKCRINVAYNYIWLGQYAEAQRIIRAQVGHDQDVSLRRYFNLRVRDLAAKALT